MFSIFKKKSLEEKRQIVKQEVASRKISFRDAHIMYAICALDKFGWEDVAESFLKDSICERLRIGG